MSDLLNEYNELIHEPITEEDFTLPEANLPDNTTMYIVDDLAMGGKTVYARRRLPFKRVDANGTRTEMSQTIAISMNISCEHYKDICRTYADSIQDIYQRYLKKPLDIAQLSKMQELAVQGWRYSPSDSDADGDNNYMEVRVNGLTR